MNNINEEPIVPQSLAELVRQQWITRRNNFINSSSNHNTNSYTITTHISPIYLNSNALDDVRINLMDNFDKCVKKPVTITNATNSQICECAICFEEKKMAKLNCGHLFCENCVNKINVCALCRSNITNIEI